MIKTGLGQSENYDTRNAVTSVISQCQQKMAGFRPQAGIVFAGVNFDHRLMLDEILDKFPGMDLIGCTTAGDFSSSYGFSDDSIRGVRPTLRLQFGKMLLNKISPELFPAIAQYDRAEGEHSLPTINAPTHA